MSAMKSIQELFHAHTTTGLLENEYKNNNV
jgi:hypothetical protein